MKEKLWSMINFILEHEKIHKDKTLVHIDVFARAITYAKFLMRNLALGMFVPCDKNNVPLTKPEAFDKYMLSHRLYMHPGWKESCEQYRDAQERVLFKGFTFEVSDPDKPLDGYLTKDNTWLMSSYDDEGKIIFQDECDEYEEKNLTTIEDLIYLDLDLTESIIKELKDES